MALVGWIKTSGHLLWNLKVDFTRKTRWVTDEHQTPDLKQSNYAGVVTWDSIRIALTSVSLNELEVTAADIHIAYLQAPSLENHYVVCNGDFGIENRGKVALIRRALY